MKTNNTHLWFHHLFAKAKNQKANLIFVYSPLVLLLATSNPAAFLKRNIWCSLLLPKKDVPSLCLFVVAYSIIHSASQEALHCRIRANLQRGKDGVHFLWWPKEALAQDCDN